VGDPGPDAAHLVRGDTGADAAAADQNAALRLHILDRAADRFGDVRVVDRVLAVRTKVDNFVVQLTDVGSEEALELETSVVCSERYAQSDSFLRDAGR
jgi:hypothetical protein